MTNDCCEWHDSLPDLFSEDSAPEDCCWATIHEQNANRRSNNGVAGVHFDKTHQRWIAKLMVNRIIVFYKYFRDYDDAVKARRNAELQYLHTTRQTQ